MAVNYKLHAEFRRFHTDSDLITTLKVDTEHRFKFTALFYYWWLSRKFIAEHSAKREKMEIEFKCVDLR